MPIYLVASWLNCRTTEMLREMIKIMERRPHRRSVIVMDSLRLSSVHRYIGQTKRDCYNRVTPHEG